MLRWLAVVVALLGCSPMTTIDGGVTEPDAGSYTPVEKRALGLNDLTYLLPLSPADGGTPSPFPTADTMIPRALFERLTTTPGDVLTDLSRLRLVGVRFDLCDRSKPMPCDANADGVFRLVHQPVFNDGSTEDIAFHSFFPVPRSEVPRVVDTLRALARLQDVPTNGRLAVNQAIETNPEFTQTLVELLRTYASTSRLFRLTLFGQLTNRPVVMWVFRGINKQGPSFVRIDIPDLQEIDQVALAASSVEFSLRPLADNPTGFVRAMSLSSYNLAPPSLQKESLEAMVATENPLLHTSDTVQCASCHVVTTLIADRTSTAGVPVTSLTNRYTSSSFDLTPLGDPAVRFRTLRGLGYFGRSPLVAQRTINETANVIGEIEARFPPAP